MNSIRKKWRQLSLKNKWAFSTATVLFISFALVCTIIYIALNNWLLNEEKQSVARSMDDLTAYFEATQGLTIADLQNNKSLMNSIVDKKQTVRIFNEDGVEIVRINDTVKKTPKLSAHIPRTNYTLEKVIVDKTPNYVATGYVYLGPFKGYLQLAHPLNGFYDMMHYILTAMLLMGVIALIAAWGISVMLSSVLLQPLKNLSLNMKRVAATKFEQPIQIEVTTADEVGDLVNVYKQMMAELEQSFKQQQRFIADASHELRTPIQVLEGHLTMLKRWGRNDPEILEESLETSIKEVTRMKALIEELLSLARREHKEEDCSVFVVEQLESVITEYQSIAKEARIQLDVDHTAQRLRAHISENAFRQIAMNLIENAVRYNSSIPVINIYLTFDSNNCTIVFEDNGIGMSQASLAHIFERFYRVDKARSREYGGSGLGLSIVQMLIDRYDGNIDVSSVLGEGTKFTIQLPLYKN